MRSFPICVTVAILSAGPLLAVEQSDYEPLSEGCEWIMNSQMVLSNGGITNGTSHRKVEGQVKRDGKIYFRIHVWQERAPSSSETIILARKDEAGYYAVAESEQDSREQMELPNPLTVGQRWRSTVGENSVINTVIGFETVTIGGKSYEKCAHIQAKWFNGSISADHWEARNVGTVKSEMVRSDGARMTLTLKEFKPGK